MTSAYFIDMTLDYLRLAAYAVVVLTSLRGIVNRKFTNILFVGDVLVALCLIVTVIYIHLYEILPSSTLLDDAVLSFGAVTWAVVHFYAMVKSDRMQITGGKRVK